MADSRATWVVTVSLVTTRLLPFVFSFQHQFGVSPVDNPQILERLDRIEVALKQLVSERTIKEFYSVCEVAEILGKAEFTVREWCRLGRIWASKRDCGRGNSKEWMISHDELTRVQNEGLLPL